MQKTSISWSEMTWNPVWGCTKVSAGCDNCYAERVSKGFGLDFSKVVLKPHKLREPLGLKKPTVVFVNSMSDLFHREVPDEFILECFNVMRKTPQHTYQILTKRPLRMLNFQQTHLPGGFPKNVWAGTSIEGNRVAHRIEDLKALRAEVRFVSFEPLIGSVMPIDLNGIHWAITGGESDFKAPRPMKPEWAREIRDECQRLGIAYFHKQSGGTTKCQCHKVWGCELLDGQTWHQYPKGPLAQEPGSSPTTPILMSYNNMGASDEFHRPDGSEVEIA